MAPTLPAPEPILRALIAELTHGDADDKLRDQLRALLGIE